LLFISQSEKNAILVFKNEKNIVIEILNELFKIKKTQWPLCQTTCCLLLRVIWNVITQLNKQKQHNVFNTIWINKYIYDNKYLVITVRPFTNNMYNTNKLIFIENKKYSDNMFSYLIEALHTCWTKRNQNWNLKKQPVNEGERSAVELKLIPQSISLVRINTWAKLYNLNMNLLCITEIWMVHSALLSWILFACKLRIFYVLKFSEYKSMRVHVLANKLSSQFIIIIESEIASFSFSLPI
jgi:hypothetical protein